MKKLLSVIIVFLPWNIRRFLLVKFWKYEIHPTAKIGLAFIYPKKLIMKENARIDHFTIGINLDLISIGHNSKIGRSNWITGFPTNSSSKHFNHQLNRKSELIIGNNTAITKNHHLDCTNIIHIGDYVTIAGYNTQFLTHSINIYENRQDSKPIIIGNYCFVGTRSIVMGGSVLPSNCVLSAGALLNKNFEEEWMIYGGVPSKSIKPIDKTAKYFSRVDGFVY